MTAFTLALATPAIADPSLGLGLSLSFGGGGDVDYGVGLRVFSDNEPDELAASVGVDYMFSSQRIRPTIGVAYLGDDAYIGINMGFGINGEGIDLGVGIGGVNTQDPTLSPQEECPAGEHFVGGSCI